MSKPEDIFQKASKHQQQRLCPICKILDYMVVSFKIINYGNVQDLLARPYCPVCRLVLGLLPADAVQDLSGSIHLHGLGRPGFAVWYGHKIRGELVYVFEDEERNHPEWESTLKNVILQLTEEVDFPQVRSWLSECDRSHSGCQRQNPFYGDKAPVETLLIDVLEARLVQSTTAERYVALSYVRGEHKMFEVDMEKCAAFEKSGALIECMPLLSRIVVEAMECVQKLGERYLWIDTLCIPHDDHVRKGHLIMQMDVIYSHALITIIPLSAESVESSLPGVKPGTRRPDIAFEELLVNDFPKPQAGVAFPKRYMAIRENLDTMSDFSPHKTRGWTFQEALLARRCLIFTDQQIFFHCRSDLRSDRTLFSYETSWTVRDVMSSLAQSTERISPEEQYRFWVQLVNSFTQRKLSYLSDSINAISGVLAVLSKSFEWKFKAGMPEHLLDRALLWRPGVAQTRNLQFPSWSWAGWSGWTDWTFHRLQVPNFASSASEPFELTPLKSELDWIVPKEYLSAPSTHYSSPEESQVISFYAHTAPATSFEFSKIRADTEDEVGSFRSIYPYREIATTEGLRCGLLYDHSEKTPQTGRENSHCEYIALSRSEWLEQKLLSTSPCDNGKFFRSTYDFMCDATKLPFSEWCFVNVMLIKWKNNVAERIAIGLVHENVWANVANATKRRIDLS